MTGLCNVESNMFISLVRFATFVVTERESKAKHLQTVAGVEPAAYWLATLLWDFINYLIPFGITGIASFDHVLYSYRMQFLLRFPSSALLPSRTSSYFDVCIRCLCLHNI
jgi:hypothetical protein